MSQKRILLINNDNQDNSDLLELLTGLGYTLVERIAFSNLSSTLNARAVDADIVLLEGKSNEVKAVATAYEIHRQYDLPMVIITDTPRRQLPEQDSPSQPFVLINRPLIRKDLQGAIEISICKNALLRLLRASTNAIHTLLSEKDLNASISRALTIIGEATDVDRVYIFEEHTDPETGARLVSQRYEWTRKGITPQIANPALQNIPYFPTFKRWHETLSSGKPIMGLIRDFPAEEMPILEEQDIVSILVVPIKINEHLWGFIGFDDCRRERVWTATEISMLTAIAANVGHVLLQRRTEITLKRFQAAIDGAGDAIGMADMLGHHFYQNRAFTNLFECTAEELEKAGGPIALYHDPSICEQVFKSILSGGSWNGEITMCNRSGRVIPILLRADVIKGKDGKPIAVMGIHTDITGRKEAERALQESEIRYRRLVEAITDYIYTVSVENGVATSTRHGPNCIAVTGYSSAEYEADPDLWFKMVHPDDQKMVLEQAQCILKEETIKPIEHRILHKNRSTRWIRNTPVPHFNADGNLISYDGLVYDVTERKNAEGQLKEHARQLEILNRIITAANRVDNLDMLLKESLQAAMEMIGFNGGGIYLVNADKSAAELICHQGLASDFIKKEGVLKLTDPNYRILFIEGQPIFTDDYRTVSSEKAKKWNIRSVAKIPLISNDKVIGALTLISSKDYIFNPKEKELLLAIGSQIGTAVAKLRSEIALRESERKYRTITEQSLVGIQIIKDGLMMFVNDGWTKITEYSPSEVMTWGIEEYLKIVHPEDRSLFLEQTRKKQFELTNGVLPIYDCRFLSKTGAIKWVSIHSKSVEFADGRAIVGMIVDITERKMAEEKIRLHSEIIKNMNGAVYLVRTDDGIIVYANPEHEKMFGYGPGEMIGKHVSIVNAPTSKSSEETAREIMAILNKTGEWHGEVNNIKKDGTRFWCYANVSIFDHPEHGRVFIAVHNDITDRKLAAAEIIAANKKLTTINEYLIQREHELLKANHEKEILLKEIHHRVKNNLQVINSLINLQIHHITDRQAVSLLKECQNRIKTIAMVHEKMYQLGDLSQVDIGSYLDSLIRHISQVYLTNHASITIMVNAKNILLPVDQAIPCALLVNELVSNSLKYAFPANKAGEIKVEMNPDETGNYVLTVSDNGVGLPPGTDYLNTKSLGMQLVNTFVSQLRGTMELEKKPGTSFKIIFAQSQKEI